MVVWAVSLLSDELSPAVLTAVVPHDSIRSLSRVGNLATPSPKQSSTPTCYRTTLALKLFRGEPAISGSIGISPLTTGHPGVLQRSLRFGPPRTFTDALQPAHG
jgi:hypothetical protein